MLTINGITVKVPSEYSVNLQDLDASAERNARGVLIRDRVRAGVYKIEVKWIMLTDAEIRTILQAVSGASFTVSFHSPYTGSIVSKTMYVGDRTAPLWNYTRRYWESLSLNLIEI